jgi:hypothetical protein
MLHDHKKEIEYDIFDHHRVMHEPHQRFHHTDHHERTHHSPHEYADEFYHSPDLQYDFHGVPDYHEFDAHEGAGTLYGGYENAMSTRTFPKQKLVKYDPDAMARELEKARKLGNMPKKEEEVPLHKDTHRR